LVPSLNGCRDRVKNDCEIQCSRELEAIGNLFTNGESIRLVELLNLFKESGRLRKEGAFCEEGLDVLQAVLVGEAVDIGEELIF
jgi:hypothetical protein